MYFGLLAFFLVAIVCVVAGAAVMKKRRGYGDSEGDDVMSDAEFRRIEGFDE
jgi:hypothetical protein